jgi:hypothetical protein
MPLWLIDALREPAAQLLNVVALAALAAAQQRIRGKQKLLRAELQEADVFKQSASSSSTPPETPWPAQRAKAQP